MVIKVVVAIILIALVFVAESKYFPHARPRSINNGIIRSVSIIALVSTTLEIPAYPAALPLPTWVIAVIIFTVAVASPMLGIAEQRYRNRPGHPPATAFSPSRFWGHLITNLIGAAIAVLLLTLARAAMDASGPNAPIGAANMIDIFLPLSALITLAFINTQQTELCPNVDSLAETDPVAAEECYYENSMRRWHQGSNALHLILVVYTSTTTLLYLLAYTMVKAKSGTPVALSVPALVVIVLGVAFVLILGTPEARKKRALFLTFLTGTPAVLSATVMWMAMFQQSLFRDLSAAVVIAGGYVIYVYLAIAELKGPQKATHWYYYGAMSIAVVLITILAALYLEPVLP